MTDLTSKKCVPCEGGVDPLTGEEAAMLLKQLNGAWACVEGSIVRHFTFRNHYEVMAFVNAAAWVSHREGHHPDLTIGYDKCTVAYITHAIKGLSVNDFICAAKIDALMDL